MIVVTVVLAAPVVAVWTVAKTRLRVSVSVLRWTVGAGWKVVRQVGLVTGNSLEQ